MSVRVNKCLTDTDSTHQRYVFYFDFFDRPGIILFERQGLMFLLVIILTSLSRPTRRRFLSYREEIFDHPRSKDGVFVKRHICVHQN